MGFLTGFHAIEEQLRRSDGNEVLYVYARGPRVKKILERARKTSVRIVETCRDELENLTGSTELRGIAMEIPGHSAGSDFNSLLLRTTGEEQACVLFLDSITDPHNLGAILRSADKFEADFVVTGTRRSATETDVVTRSSAGASAHIPLVCVSNLVRAIDAVKKAGFWIYGADMNGEPARGVDFSRKVAIVMGSEGCGLSRLVRESCDKIVSIPARGNVDSLNVSVAAGVLLYELRRQQGW